MSWFNWATDAVLVFEGFVAGVWIMTLLRPSRMPPDFTPLADLIREHATQTEGNHAND